MNIMSAILALISLFLGVSSTGSQPDPQYNYTTLPRVQMEYNVKLDNVPESKRDEIVKQVVQNMQRRIENTGIKFATVEAKPAQNETHLIVELPKAEYAENLNTDLLKNVSLEFKEQSIKKELSTETALKNEAQTLLNRAKKTSDIKKACIEAQIKDSKKISCNEIDFKFKDEMPEVIANILPTLSIGAVYNKVIQSNKEYMVDGQGTLTSANKFYIVQLIGRQGKQREIKHDREVKVSHLLVAYKGAERAANTITRTKDEAKARTEEALKKLTSGEPFEKVSNEYSDDEASKKNGGALDIPVSGKGTYVKEFEVAVNALQKPGELTGIIETPFGYHIIKANGITEASLEKKMEDQAKYFQATIQNMSDPWTTTGLNQDKISNAEVEFNQNTQTDGMSDQNTQPYVMIEFNNEGSKLFADITGKNIGKPLGIFLEGTLLSAPMIQQKITGGKAQLTGNFTVEEAERLASKLNSGKFPTDVTFIKAGDKPFAKQTPQISNS